MKQFIVNVVEQKITPFVVEAEDEWQAMVKAKDGDGYMHHSGPVDLTIDPKTWEVSEFEQTNLWEEWI